GLGKNTLILPVAARDEEKQPTTQESMFNFVRMSDGGILRLNHVRSEVDIIADIATTILGNEKVNFSALKNHRHIRDAIGGMIPGFGKIKALDGTREEFQIEGRTFHHPEFATADKKALFTTVNIPEPNGEKGQFRMASIRSEGQFNTIIYEEYDSYRNVNHRWTVLMNTNDMVALRLKEGDKVTIKNDIGSMEGVAVQDFDIPPGNVATYFPESNVLISAQSDRRSKTPGFKSTMVTIAPQIN
ncbi:MAG: molybdopterin dinucleotide binding domain-containing protein, partial [Candidatus Neomarinimicrobiota bacterium]|nr:molybdopterin dinucleotide binding domain-containing protein [Candidatus Neomarinimicrobiota bacterium]